MNESWEDLAGAIIMQAVADYRKCRVLVRTKPNQKAAQAMIREVERFFRSRWFCQLTELDGNRILNKLKEEVA